ncbi:MAG: GspB domain-containing protein, partial [Xanthomonadales bacterium]|nr:general secretion pathway protein GspB [Xanthomonadales bacterium]NIX11846.1 GspB domain-containing protein [Xanthomonadales bacterium]
QPPRPSFITYWQLPDSIRAELPEFRVRVMVYAERPEDRFILVNGQRLLEGDSLQPGLVVREIRRDGVVFSYRLYEFLVTR